MSKIENVVFDLGNVLVDWSVRAWLRDKGISEGEISRLLGGPLRLEWHSRADGGIPLLENVRQRAEVYPNDAAIIQAYGDDWIATIRGEIAGSVKALRALHQRAIPLFAITNFPSDMYAPYCARFDFMSLFFDVIVSGDVGLIKPDPRVFALAIDRFAIDPQRSLFIDDRAENCAAAESLGFQTHHFVEDVRLVQHLSDVGLLSA